MDVLHSGFLDSLLELREEEVDASRVEQNWFSSVNAQKLYDSYVGMDEDQNGMLNKKELKRFGDTRATFTDAFIDRFFEENITYDGEIVCLHDESSFRLTDARNVFSDRTSSALWT